MGWFGNATLADVRLRLERLERKFEALLSQLDVKLPEDSIAEYRDLIDAGAKLLAVKRYRERTGADLYEAKEAIDEIERSSRKAK